MKNRLILFAVIIAALVVPQSVKAYDFSYTYQGKRLYFNILDGNAQVTYERVATATYTYTGSIIIPAAVTNGGHTYAVTSIGEAAFAFCSGLTSVTIPDAVTSIGERAFSGCSGLTSVTIPDAVTSIGGSAFSGCSGLTSVTIPAAVTSIGHNAISSCSGLTSIVVSSGNATYDSRNNCNAIIETSTNTLIAGCKNTIIPISVISIGTSAFSGCSGLTSIAIPDAVTSIGQYAFSGCSGLTSVTIPDAVTSIGEAAFSNCSGLTSVAFNADSCTSAGSYSYSVFNNCTNITNFTFGDNVKVIPAYLCHGLGDLTSVTIPDVVTSIGNAAFEGCSGLTSVTIGNGVTSIGNYAFRNCIGLTSATIGNAVTSIGYDAFSGCSGLTSVTIPDVVTSIGYNAFRNCSGLTSVTIPDAVTYIGEGAFSNCSGLTSVNIGNGITSISDDTFAGCSGLTSVTIPDAVTSIGEYAFSACRRLDSLTVGSSVTTIGQDAFAYDTLVYLNYNCNANIPTVFAHNKLTTVVIGNAVTTIGSSAFANSRNLTSVTIGNGVTSIGGNAFENCSNLTSVTIPDAVTSIGYGAFGYCGGLTSIVVSSGNAQYDSRNNCNAIIKTSTNTLIAGCKNTEIPNTVASIGYAAFAGCSDLTSVTIPDAVTSIGQYAFSGCSGLTSITIPDAVTSIGGNAFENCSGLTSVTIPDSITSIETRAFYGCSGLRIIKALPITPPTLGSNVFNNVASGAKIIVPRNSYNSYLSQWSVYRNMIKMDQYTVTLHSNDSSIGTVLGAGTYNYRDTVEVSAMPIAHHHFVRWSDDNSDNPRQFVIESDVDLTAIFVIDTYTVSVAVNDILRGTVSASGTEFVYGTPCTVEATPYSGYTFAGWSNGSTFNPYTFAVSSDVELTAIFLAPGEETNTVTVGVNDPAMGSATVNGSTSATVMTGTEVTLAAIANVGYRFVRWSDNDTHAVRNVTVTADISFTAIFEAYNPVLTYTVTVGVNDPAMGSATVNGNASATVMSGTEVTLAAIANEGYRFVKWNDNDTNAVRNVTVTADMIFTATFESLNAIDDVRGETVDVRVYAEDGSIVVVGAADMSVYIYDVMGRLVERRTKCGERRAVSVSATGLYFVKVGTLPMKKVVVVK